MSQHAPVSKFQKANRPPSKYQYHKSISKSFRYDSYKPPIEKPLEVVDHKTNMASPIRLSTTTNPTNDALQHQDSGSVVTKTVCKSHVEASELFPSSWKADTDLTVLDLSGINGHTRDSINNTVSLYRHVQKCLRQIESLEKENRGVQSKLEVLRNENQSINESLRSSEAARETLRAVAQRDSIEIKELKAGWDSLKVKYAKLQEDVQAQREDRTKAENKYNDLLSKHERLKGQHNSLTIRFANFKAEASKLEANLKATDSDWKMTQSQMTDLTTRFATTKETLDKYARENNSLRCLLTEAYGELRDLIHRTHSENHGSVEAFTRQLHQIAIDFARDAQASNEAKTQAVTDILESKVAKMQTLGLARSPSPRKSLHDIENDDVIVVNGVQADVDIAILSDDCRQTVCVKGSLPTPTTTPRSTPPAKLKMLKRKSPQKEDGMGEEEQESDGEPLAGKRRKRKDIYDLE